MLIQETQETQAQSWVGKIPWSGTWQPTPVFVPVRSHGQRSLAGYSPWGHKEADMTEHKHKIKIEFKQSFWSFVKFEDTLHSHLKSYLFPLIVL